MPARIKNGHTRVLLADPFSRLCVEKGVRLYAISNEGCRS